MTERRLNFRVTDKLMSKQTMELLKMDLNDLLCTPVEHVFRRSSSAPKFEVFILMDRNILD